MQQLPATFEEFLADESGSSAIEYALVVAVVSLLIMGTLSRLSGALRSLSFGLAELIADVTRD